MIIQEGSTHWCLFASDVSRIQSRALTCIDRNAHLDLPRTGNRLSYTLKQLSGYACNVHNVSNAKEMNTKWTVFIYESAIYFANIPCICFYERNDKKIQIFRVKWHRFRQSVFTLHGISTLIWLNLCMCFLSIPFIKTDVWDFLQNKWHSHKYKTWVQQRTMFALIVGQSSLWVNLGLPIVSGRVYVCVCVYLDRSRTLKLVNRF